MHALPDILIVDDTPDHIRIAGSILKNEGYQIRVATSGSLALSLMNQQLPALVLLDIQMEDMDGFAVLNAMKTHENLRDIPVIFLTADTDRGTLQRCFACGGADYIQKPYEPFELIARVASQIKIASQAASLKESYNELNQFCHSVSHDLKSPLQVITQLTLALKEDMSETPQLLNRDMEELMNRITAKCASTIVMIERLLDFSKMAELSCHFESIQLTPFITAIYQELKSLEPANRQINFHIEALPAIRGDRALCTQLFQNILSNAIKFTRHKTEAEITVASQQIPEGLQITITDNGAGFDMEYSSKLFHVFERLHSADEFEGSGVGLAMVRRIMEKTGGQVSIFGEPGTGTCVTLLFSQFSEDVPV